MLDNVCKIIYFRAVEAESAWQAHLSVVSFSQMLVWSPICKSPKHTTPFPHLKHFEMLTTMKVTEMTDATARSQASSSRQKAYCCQKREIHYKMNANKGHHILPGTEPCFEIRSGHFAYNQVSCDGCLFLALVNHCMTWLPCWQHHWWGNGSQC